MKNLLFIAIGISSLLLTSCGESAPSATPKSDTSVTAEPAIPVSVIETFSLGAKLVWVEKSTEAEFEAVAAQNFDTSEKRALSVDPAATHRVGDTLFLKTDARIVQLVNKESDGDDAVNYIYLGTLGNSGKYVVYALFYESHGFAMIDKALGDTTWLIGSPVLSPDGKYIIAGNCDLMAGFTENGFELFENTKPKTVEVGRKVLEKWGPDVVKWQTDSTLLVRALRYDEHANEQIEYLKLTIRQ